MYHFSIIVSGIMIFIICANLILFASIYMILFSICHFGIIVIGMMMFTKLQRSCARNVLCLSVISIMDIWLCQKHAIPVLLLLERRFCQQYSVAVHVQQRSCSLTGLCCVISVWIISWMMLLLTMHHFCIYCFRNDAFVKNESFLHLTFS